MLDGNVRWRTIALAGIMMVLAACQNDEPAQTTGVRDVTTLVLAISWQPAFCETATRRPECRSQKPDRFDADHFSLHGLWPQPRSAAYCGVEDEIIKTDKSRRWHKLPALELGDATRDELNRVMPGSQSALHRHEWFKHGTCYSYDAETYYRDSLKLMAAINESQVRAFFASSLGRRISGQQIRNAFDRAFGNGVGKRVRISCKRDGQRQIITELTIGLEGHIADTPDIQALALAARPTQQGCPGGVVDRVGLQ